MSLVCFFPQAEFGVLFFMDGYLWGVQPLLLLTCMTPYDGCGELAEFEIFGGVRYYVVSNFTMFPMGNSSGQINGSPKKLVPM
jgi:hypothetical protein